MGNQPVEWRLRINAARRGKERADKERRRRQDEEDERKRLQEEQRRANEAAGLQPLPDDLPISPDQSYEELGLD